MDGSREGTGTGNEQRASGRGANRGSDQPWKSEREFCRRSMHPFRGANQLTCDGRVSRVVAVGAERSQFAVVVAFAAGRLTPCDRRGSPARVPVVRLRSLIFRVVGESLLFYSRRVSCILSLMSLLLLAVVAAVS